MTTLRMDHVSVVIGDLDAGIAFFTALGMEVEGRAQLEGTAVDQLNALDDVRAEIAMMRTPDGLGKLELTTFHHPAAIRAEPADTPSNAFGLRSVMFQVDDLAATLADLRPHRAELVGEVAQHEDVYRLCYVRGPEGIIVALAQELG